MGAPVQIQGQQFAAFLASNVPVYDEEVAKDFRPVDGGLAGYYRTMPFEGFTGVQHTFNRYRSNFPNLTGAWFLQGSESGGLQTECNGTPCDRPQQQISWGTDRFTYPLEGQQWSTQLLCYDEMMTVTQAADEFRYIISDVLAPVSKWVTGDYVMKRAIAQGYSNRGGPYCVTSAGLQQFSMAWEPGGYVFLDTTLNTGGAADPVGKMTPPILQLFAQKLYMDGAVKRGEEYFDRLEFHTDQETFWDMRQGNPTLSDKLRFTWGEFPIDAPEFYRFGFKGFVGDYAVKCLDFPLRFNKVSSGRYQYVPPFTNSSATIGTGSTPNQAWINAHYQFSLINNRRAFVVKPFKPHAINPEMPFMLRDYAGKWRFVMNNLGADANGVTIDNSRMNKGKFIADYELAFQAIQPEWCIPFFHVREPQCVLIIGACSADPGYPTQNYNSAPVLCNSIQLYTPVVNASGTGGPVGQYLIPATSVLVNGNIVSNPSLSATTVANLIISLNSTATTAALGTWSLYTDGVSIALTEPAGVQNTVVVRFQQ